MWVVREHNNVAGDTAECVRAITFPGVEYDVIYQVLVSVCCNYHVLLAVCCNYHMLVVVCYNASSVVLRMMYIITH